MKLCVQERKTLYKFTTPNEAGLRQWQIFIICSTIKGMQGQRRLQVPHQKWEAGWKARKERFHPRELGVQIPEHMKKSSLWLPTIGDKFTLDTMKIIEKYEKDFKYVFLGSLEW